jgi:hypothetical protein
MSPKQKRYLYNTGGILLSVLFIYFCVHSLKNEDLSRVFSVPRPWYLLAVVALNGVLMALRTYLWMLLLSPIKALPFGTLFDILHVGYMANNLLPLKAGEFFRSSFVAKKWQLPYARVLTTVGLERFFAGLSLLLIFFAITFWLELPLWLKSGAYSLMGVLMAVQVWLWILWVRKPDLQKWKERHPLIYHFIKVMDHIEKGSSVLKNPRAFFVLLLLGLLGWCCQAYMLRLIESAYQITLPWPATLFVLVAINLAISLPSAPSNLGTFEFAAILAYSFVGIDKATGLGIALFFHFLQVIPVTLIGLFYYWRWGIRFKDIERAAEDGLEEVLP